MLRTSSRVKVLLSFLEEFSLVGLLALFEMISLTLLSTTASLEASFFDDLAVFLVMGTVFFAVAFLLETGCFFVGAVFVFCLTAGSLLVGLALFGLFLFFVMGI